MFYLIGLPRCRTAWFANLFTFDGVVCDHDHLKGGDGYCGSILHDDAMKKPSVYIHRPVVEVIDSLKRRFEFPEGADFEALDRALSLQAEQMAECPGYHVRYNDLNTESIAAIWEFLLRTPADIDRIVRMERFNIQVNYTNIMDALEV